MKVSELWLRSFIDPKLPIAALADQLTDAGIEVDSLEQMEGKTPDEILTLKIPPNRGDCLSMEGVARELSLLVDLPYQSIPLSTHPAKNSVDFPIHVMDFTLCPKYIGCVIKKINNKKVTPDWMNLRLETAGIRSLSPVVDIMNYVMIELGQPMHAFDLNAIDKEIIIRKAKDKEKITLLNDQEIELDAETLVIADHLAPQAIAGVMGGLKSSVTENTTSILIESAYFNPISIRKAAQRFGLRTDSSHRFERGIDPELQMRAMNRAIQLILAIVGGELESISVQQNEMDLPKNVEVLLRTNRVNRILNLNLNDQEIANILKRAHMQLTSEKEGYLVLPPSYRQDISLEVDLIEEIARIYGMHRLKSEKLKSTMNSFPITESIIPTQQFKKLLVDRGYNEAITYSFVDAKLIEILDSRAKPFVLANPISNDMSAMRTSLWPGLLQTIQYNQRRQASRARIFELGVCFIEENGKMIEKQILGGACAGPLYAEQWDLTARMHDFFDLKNDMEALLALTMDPDIAFEKYEHPTLHPGQTARILRNQQPIGFIGAVHPRVLKALELEEPILIFEIELSKINNALKPVFRSLSKFPAIRRDIAILVDQAINVAELKVAIAQCAGECLQSISLFDVYQGKNIEPGKKSVALGLILQHPSRTLVEGEVNDIVKEIVKMLSKQFQATLRE